MASILKFQQRKMIFAIIMAHLKAKDKRLKLILTVNVKSKWYASKCEVD